MCARNRNQTLRAPPKLPAAAREESRGAGEEQGEGRSFVAKSVSESDDYEQFLEKLSKM